MSKRADGTNISNATELCKSWSSVRLHSKCGKKALGHFRQRMRVGPICIIKSLLGVLTVGGRGGRHGSREVVAVQSQGALAVPMREGAGSSLHVGGGFIGLAD